MIQPKVSVIIPAYNHEPYIRDAIESALSQDCSDPFEIIIGDDASTDGTREICLEYGDRPEVRVFSHTENRGLIANYHSLFSAAAGAYIAILEGDDLWEKNKLTRQIAYLESHPDHGMVHSNGYFLYENGKRRLIHREAVPRDYGFRELFRKNLIVSVTACFRRELLKHVDLGHFQTLGFRTIDYPLWLEFSQHTTIGYIHEPLAIYRITDSSISNNRSLARREAFEASSRSIREYYLEKYPGGGLDNEMIQSTYHRRMFHFILARGRFSDLKSLQKEYLELSGIKMLAFRCRIFFLFYQGIIRLFYSRT